MSRQKILLLGLTDDPLDPPGYGRYGGAQGFMFDLGRHLVRSGIEVLYITRKSRPDKPLFQSLGPLCRIYRIEVGPPFEVSHHELWTEIEIVSQRVTEISNGEDGISTVMSYNWISGLAAMATGVRPLVHHILSLGRSRIALGEESDASDLARDQGEVRVFSAADRLICVCRDEINSLKRLYPEVDDAKAVVIPYGVDPNVYYERPLHTDLFLCRSTQRFQERS